MLISLTHYIIRFHSELTAKKTEIEELKRFVVFYIKEYICKTSILSNIHFVAEHINMLHWLEKKLKIDLKNRDAFFIT